MELVNGPMERSAQQWTNKTGKKRLPTVDYNSELRSWVQHAILEAEKNRDSSKKDQLLDLLKDL